MPILLLAVQRRCRFNGYHVDLMSPAARAAAALAPKKPSDGYTFHGQIDIEPHSECPAR